MAAKRATRSVHEAADCRDIDQEEALIQPAAAVLWPWLCS
jgi:hypothetical protein